MDKLSLLPTRQIQITREDVARIDGCAQILAVARVTVSFGSPLIVAVSWVTIRFLAANGRRIGAASQNDPIFFPIANAVVPGACILIARIVVEHRKSPWPLIAKSIMRGKYSCGNSHSGRMGAFRVESAMAGHPDQRGIVKMTSVGPAQCRISVPLFQMPPIYTGQSTNNVEHTFTEILEMVDLESSDGASHAAWTALYQTASQQWTHAEQVRWTLLYNYLMASTILLLAWSAVFASADHSPEKAAVLVLLSAGGAALSALWVGLGLRATSFVGKYASAGRELEAAMIHAARINPPNSPFAVAAQHRQVIAGVARHASSALVLWVVPTIFLLIYIVLVWVSFDQPAQLRFSLGQFENTMSITEQLTAALVVITGIYAVLTYGIMRANRQTVAAMNAQTEALSRPYLSISPFTLPENAVVFLRISNTGRTAAENARLELDRPYYRFGKADESENLRNLSVFSEPISSVGPGAEFIFSLAMAPVLYGSQNDVNRTPLTFRITASYRFFGKVVTEITEVDLRPFRGMHMSFDPVVHELSGIKEAIKARD